MVSICLFGVFCYVLVLVIKVVCNGFGIALLPP
nr:DUF3265 domain-containing protein [Vibrio campbellii]